MKKNLEYFFLRKVQTVMIISFMILSLFYTAYSLLEMYSYQKKVELVVQEILNNVLIEKSYTGDILNLQRDLKKLLVPVSSFSSIKVEVYANGTSTRLASLNIGQERQILSYSNSKTLQLSTPSGNFTVITDIANQFLENVILRSILLLLSFALFFFIISKLIKRMVLEELRFADLLIEDIRNFDVAKSVDFSTMVFSKMNSDINILQDARSNFFSQLDLLNKRIIEMKVSQEASSIATQVAHDIRSPLSALNILLEELQNMPDNVKNLASQAISRINEIAEDLLKFNLNRLKKNQSEIERIESIRLILNNILSEKRIQFSKNKNIRFIISSESEQDAAIKANLTDFQRVVSNIINNSVEGLISETGIVEVSINKYGNYVLIHFIDNGKGIPKDILPLITSKGFSFGKEKYGSGLGLSHASEVVNALNGTLRIESEENIGTKVTLTFPIDFQE